MNTCSIHTSFSTACAGCDGYQSRQHDNNEESQLLIEGEDERAVCCLYVVYFVMWVH
jgi:hypothetical protein